MSEAAAAVAPPEVAAAPQGPPSVEKKPEAKPFRFGWKPGAKFSIDGFLVEGCLDGTVLINDKLQVGFRSLSVEELQLVEACVDMTQSSRFSGKYLTNELTIAQIYWSMESLNGKPLPKRIDVGDWGKKNLLEADLRSKFVRGLPGVFFDMVTAALNEFDRRCKELISPEAVKSF